MSIGGVRCLREWYGGFGGGVCACVNGVVEVCVSGVLVVCESCCGDECAFVSGVVVVGVRLKWCGMVSWRCVYLCVCVRPRCGGGGDGCV
jgi:hypothetical protein